MKHDADRLADPYWKAAYTLLVAQYQRIEGLLHDRVADLVEAQEYIERLQRMVEYRNEQLEALRIEYAARLKALGMHEQVILPCPQPPT
jgi:hypothetical protein